jgi:hypothetical protein
MKLRVYMIMECCSSNHWSLAAAWVIAGITVLLMVCCGFFFPHSRLVSSRMALHESPAYGTSQPALPPAMDLPKRSTEVCTHDSTHPKVPPKSAGVLHLTTTAVTCCCYACISPNKKIENIICTFYYIIQLAEINWQTSLDFPNSLELYCSVITRDQQREQLSWRKCSDVPYMVTPGIMVSVEDHGSTQATSWVDTSSCNGDGCQMHQVDCKPNGKGRKYLPHKCHMILWVHTLQGLWR